jgi:hypothetical protein
MILHTVDWPISGIGRRTNGINRTSNKRHRGLSQFTIRIIMIEFNRSWFFNQWMSMKECNAYKYNNNKKRLITRSKYFILRLKNTHDQKVIKYNISSITEKTRAY